MKIKQKRITNNNKLQKTNNKQHKMKYKKQITNKSNEIDNK